MIPERKERIIMQEFLATGKVLYVLAGLCLLSMLCKWTAKGIYKRLIRETTNMAMTKNKNLKILKQRVESTYRTNGGVGNMPVYLERQAADFKCLGITLSGWGNFSNQLTLLCFLVGGAAAFLTYWYRNDTYYIALYGTMGILTGLLTMVVDMGVNLGEKRQQLLVALEDYMDNSLFFRPGKGRMAVENEEYARTPEAAGRTVENGYLEGEGKESAPSRRLRGSRKKEAVQEEQNGYLKHSLEQIAASRDKSRPEDGNWLKDLKPEEVKLLGEIIREYLS